ncbi:MAG: hypothetical protein ACYDAO_00460 [Thermoplasmataceae archaeon]
MKITESKIYGILEALSKMDMIEIKKGGKYTVVSQSGKDEPMTTVGEFVGYTILGEEGAICFRVSKENEKSLLRLIPVAGLIAIEFDDEELLSPKKKEDSTDKTTYFN